MQTTQNVSHKVPMNEESGKEKIGKAIGRIASGVFVVTLEQNGVRDGILASWIAQAAFSPPMISVAVQKERHILEHMGVGKQFCVNVLSKENMAVFKNFAKPYSPDLDRFAGLALLKSNEGAPVFAEALAYIKVVTRTIVEAGDHVVVLGEIIAADVLSNHEPMVHLRKNGFQY